MSVDVIKQELLSKLKQEHCFWSYNEDSIKDIPDNMLIEKTLLHLDLEEISQLFLVYPFKKIKHAFYINGQKVKMSNGTVDLSAYNGKLNLKATSTQGGA